MSDHADAVHAGGDVHSVPMDRSGLVREQLVGDVDHDRITGAHLYRRAGQHAIDRLDVAHSAVGRHAVRTQAVCRVEYCAVEARTRQHRVVLDVEIEDALEWLRVFRTIAQAFVAVIILKHRFT